MIETLWPFQVETVDRVEAATERRVIVCAPTGSGKTVVAMELARRALDRGQRTTFIVPRRELMHQTCVKLDRWAPCNYGLIHAGTQGQSLFAPIQVCSIDTLVSRAVKRNRLVLPPADLVLVDEAHLYQSDLRTELLDQYSTAKIVGLSATPTRHDGKALSVTFDKMIEVLDVRTLTEQKYLVPALYYAPTVPDMERAKITAGDWNQKDAQERMMPLLGDIVEHWLRLAPERRTAVFAASVAQSVYLAQQFRAEGVAAEHCDAQTDAQERDAIFARFRSGETQVLCNVELCTYGFDLPELSCAVLARPTRSIVRYLQAIGRALRTAPLKENALIIDHAGSVHFHGKADEERFWTLEGLKSKVREPATVKAKERKAPRALTCPACTFVFSGSLTCPQCRHHFEAMAKKFHVVDGELVSYAEEMREQATTLQKMRFYCELLGHGRNKGYKPGWASYTFKERYKAWPPRQWNTYTPMEPSMETHRYIRHLFIRKAKAKQAAARLAAEQQEAAERILV